MATMTRDETGSEQRHERDGEQDRGDRHEPVHQAHDDPVERAHVAGDEADDEADGDADRGHGDADEERDAAAVDDAAVDVAAEAVGAHPVA